MFFVRVESLVPIPINKNGLNSTTRFSFEDERFIGMGVVVDEGGDFMNVLFLSWGKL